MTNVDAGSKVPPPNFEKVPVEGPGEVIFEETFGVVTPTAAKDTLGRSEALKGKRRVFDADKPELDTPNELKINGENLEKAVREIKKNPWFMNASFLSAFTTIVNELIKLQSKIRFKEAETELKVRHDLVEMAKTSASLAKDLMNNQAQEQMIQAVSSFASAAVSTAQAVQTTRNLGAAENQAQKEINKKQDDINTKYHDSNLKPDANNEFNFESTEAMENIKSDPQKMANYKKEVDELNKIKENKHNKIQELVRHKDMITQSMSEAQKQAISGSAAIFTSYVKSDSANLEYLQKMNEGFIQALNKLSESVTKHRDEAASEYTRWVDEMKKIIESTFKAHSLSGRA